MSRSLLLVEDNPTDEKLTLHAFKKGNLDCTVDVVRDGAEALDFLFRQGAFAGREGEPLPALVLLDLKLPRIQGLEVLRRVRADARTRLVPVVVLTASREDEDLLQSYASGANGYVRKPVDLDEFVEAARHLGLYWLTVNQPAPPPGRVP